MDELFAPQRPAWRISSQKRPVTPETLFLIGSVSKTITATALMQLFEEGKFGLDDDIDNYLPFHVDIPFQPDAPVTFRQLLTHTASIDDNPDYINCPGWCTYGSSIGPFVTRGADSPVSLADFTKGYLTPDGPYYDWDRNFELAAPGTKSDYSNMGLVIVGYLVEVISGVPFDQVLQDAYFHAARDGEVILAAGGNRSVDLGDALRQEFVRVRSLWSIR